MRGRIEDLLQNLCTLLLQGDVAALTKHFATPLPVFHPAGMKLMATKEQTSRAMAIMVDGIKQIGATRVTYTILSLSPSDAKDRVTCLLKFHYLNAEGELLRESKMAYYFEPLGEDWKVTMIEYEKTAFEEVFEAPGTLN